MNLFLVPSLLSICLLLSPQSFHLPEGFVPSFMAFSVHGDIFPHLSHVFSMPSCSSFSPASLEHKKPFSLFLRQTLFFFFFFFWQGEEDFSSSGILPSLHCLALVDSFHTFLVPCVCKYSLSLNLLFHYWGALYIWLTVWALEPFLLLCPHLKLLHLILTPQKFWKWNMFFLLMFPAASCCCQRLKLWISKFQGHDKN